MHGIQLQKTDSSSKDLKSDIKFFFSVSLLVFLFILFFQPFDLVTLNFNNKLLFIAGMGTIIFMFSILFHIWTPVVFPKFFKTGKWEVGPAYITSVLVVVSTSVSYVFYLRFVGSVSLSMFIVFKIFIICLAPEIVIRDIYKERLLRLQINTLRKDHTRLLTILEKYNLENQIDSIELYSENRSEKIELHITDLVLIKSADNYIEVFYKEEEQIKKKLIRNSLKNIEEQLNKYNVFIRCHRTSLVNVKYIAKLIRNDGAHKIQMLEYDEEIPVSRQYLLRVKEAIEID